MYCIELRIVSEEYEEEFLDIFPKEVIEDKLGFARSVDKHHHGGTLVKKEECTSSYHIIPPPEACDSNTGDRKSTRLNSSHVD